MLHFVQKKRKKTYFLFEILIKIASRKSLPPHQHPLTQSVNINLLSMELILNINFSPLTAWMRSIDKEMKWKKKLIVAINIAFSISIKYGVAAVNCDGEEKPTCIFSSIADE